MTEEQIRPPQEKPGQSHGVTIIRDGDPKAPVVDFEMDISDTLAFNLTTRVTEFRHDCHMHNTDHLEH